MYLLLYLLLHAFYFHGFIEVDIAAFEAVKVGAEFAGTLFEPGAADATDFFHQGLGMLRADFDILGIFMGGAFATERTGGFFIFSVCFFGFEAHG